MIINNELERIWKEAVVALFELLSQHLLGRTEKILKTSHRIASVPAEI
jgi:hypothetical protein